VLRIFRVWAVEYIDPAGSEDGLMRWAILYPFGDRAVRNFETRVKDFSMHAWQRSLSASFVLTCVVTASAAEPFRREDWLADFEAVKAALTTGYPSLEWHAERGMDLAAHERRARERLAAANDDTAARVALERFVANFGDGHLELSWAEPSPKTESSPPPICSGLGYVSRPDTSAVASGLAGYTAIGTGGANVSTGTFVAGKKKIGVLRISLFMADAALCERAIHQLNVGARPSCGEQCLADVAHRTEALLVEFMEAAVRDLVAAKVDLILVDVAGNGGGNDSAIAAARMLTAAPLASPRMTFVRSEARAADLRENAVGLRTHLESANPRARKFLEPLVRKLDQAAVESSQRCDLSPLWQGRTVSCSNLLSAPFFAGGLIGEELPEEFRGAPWAEQVSLTAQYQFTPALWTGPLMVLVDGGSGSATELFTAMLQDGGRVRVIGAPTAGAGCGWTLPRKPVELPRTHGRITMPDCARVRRDGTNELDGIQPDVLIGFRRFDSTPQRVRRLQAALPTVFGGTP